MDRSYVRTYYVSHRIDVPRLVAQAAYDELIQDTTSECWVLADSPVRLELHGPVRRFPGSGWWPLRSRAGTLTVRRLRWPVELELLPWSRERTELGLQPGSRALRALPPYDVTLAGHELLQQLAARMHAWADRPLRAWAGDAIHSRVIATSTPSDVEAPPEKTPRTGGTSA